jgi:hypothetical protein
LTYIEDKTCTDVYIRVGNAIYFKFFLLYIQLSMLKK